MTITRLAENLTTAGCLAVPAHHPEADPDFANELYVYGCSHVDADH